MLAKHSKVFSNGIFFVSVFWKMAFRIFFFFAFDS